MAIHLVQHGKSTYVCGLFWQSLSRPRDLRADATALARKINFDLMVLRKDQGIAQAGYAMSTEGVQRGMLSVAAAVSKTVATDGAYYDGRQQPAQNWLAALLLPDGKWLYLAVRDGNFLPNGDFAGTREDVLERLHGDYALGGWNVVIGEKELADQGFHNFNGKSLHDLLPHPKSGQLWSQSAFAMQPVVRRLPWKALAIGGVLFALVVLSGFAVWKHLKNKEEEAARALAIENARKNLAAQTPPEAAPRPWPGKPLPEAMVNACKPDLHLMWAGGWQFEEYQCTPASESYAWARGGSNVGYLLEAVPEAAVTLTGENAVFSQPHSLRAGGDEALMDSKDMLAFLQSRFQALSIAPRIALVPIPPQPTSSLPGMPQKEVLPPTWKTYSLLLNTGGLPPTTVLDVVSQPGIRLDKLSYRQGEWVLEGVVYAN